MNKSTRCGYVALVGRANVGKSTLVNRLLGQKVCITSRKPQTTRYPLLGMDTTEFDQVIYVDTPGIAPGEKRMMNQYMNRAAINSLHDVDVIVMMLDKCRWVEVDEVILTLLSKKQIPVILVINKIDLIKDKDRLLPFIELSRQKFNFTAIIPLSAKKNVQMSELREEIIQRLPIQEFIYPPDQLTNRSVRFLVAEIIREKVFRLSGDEIPFASAVEIESFKERDDITHINALIIVEREGQKHILIGKNGEKLKDIGTKARIDIEHLLNSKVNLQLWIKQKSGWSENEAILNDLGFE